MKNKLALATILIVTLGTTAYGKDRCAMPPPPTADYIQITPWRKMETMGVTERQTAAVRPKGMTLTRICPNGQRVFTDGKRLYLLWYMSGSPAFLCERMVAYYIQPLALSTTPQGAC